MLLKRIPLVVVLVMAMVPLSAWAESLDIGLGPFGDFTAPGLGVPLTTTGMDANPAGITSVNWLGGPYGPISFSNIAGLGTVDITTGPMLTLDVSDDGGTFAGGGQITITSNGDWPAFDNEVVFSGQFLGPVSLSYEGTTDDFILRGSIGVDPGFLSTYQSIWGTGLSTTGNLIAFASEIGGADPFYINSGDIYVPEPATLSLFSLGLIGLAGMRRRLLG